MYTCQTDHRPRRDVYARLYRHFGVPFRTARFHKFFGYRDVMLALARSSAHHGDSKTFDLSFSHTTNNEDMLRLENHGTA